MYAIGRIMRFSNFDVPTSHFHTETFDGYSVKYQCTIDKHFCFKQEEYITDPFVEFQAKCAIYHPVSGILPDSTAFAELVRTTKLPVTKYDFVINRQQCIDENLLWAKQSVDIYIGEHVYSVPLHHQAVQLITPQGSVDLTYRGKFNVQNGSFIKLLPMSLCRKKTHTFVLPDKQTVLTFALPKPVVENELYLVDQDIFPMYVTFGFDLDQSSEEDSEYYDEEEDWCSMMDGRQRQKDLTASCTSAGIESESKE